jgi:hypothetical protein
MKKKQNTKRTRPSQWEHVDSARHANIYTDRMKVQGGYLYLVTKMSDPKYPALGARPYAMTFVPSTYRVINKGIVAERVR